MLLAPQRRGDVQPGHDRNEMWQGVCLCLEAGNHLLPESSSTEKFLFYKH